MLRFKVRPTLMLLAGGTLCSLALVSSSAPYLADAAVSEAPTLHAPASGSLLANFNPTLQWSLPAGAVQYQIRVTPPDGPAINLIRNAGSSYIVPPPPDWYGLLPDMTYTWQVRASDATTGISENDPSWGPWSVAASFRSPKVSSTELAAVTPASGSTTTGFLPTLLWKTNSSAIWYFEVQVSRDRTFNADPVTATAPVYWELRHGGATATRNSYTIPASYPLEPGMTYYWRIRPRIQGDGSPVDWIAPASFTTPAANALFLDVLQPTTESAVTAASLRVSGKTAAGAIVTVDSTLASVDASGSFTADVTLTAGINTLDVIASDSNGNSVSSTLTVTYLP